MIKTVQLDASPADTQTQTHAHKHTRTQTHTHTNTRIQTHTHTPLALYHYCHYYHYCHHYHNCGRADIPLPFPAAASDFDPPPSPPAGVARASSASSHSLSEIASLFELSPCLSRACLGKMIVFRMKMASQKRRFFAPAHQSFRPRPEFLDAQLLQLLLKRLCSFVCVFPSVCPEPALVKGSFSSINSGPKPSGFSYRPKLLLRIRRRVVAPMVVLHDQVSKHLALCKKTVLFCEFSLCLSRACPGKFDRLYIKTDKWYRFLACSN